MRGPNRASLVGEKSIQVYTLNRIRLHGASTINSLSPERQLAFPRWIRTARNVGYALFLVRFNLIVLVAGWLLLLVDQGQDALIGYALGDKGLSAGVWFFLWVFYWAFSIWFFARTMFRFRYPTTPSSSETTADGQAFGLMTVYLPRVLGALAFVVVAHALMWASGAVEKELAGRFFVWSGVSLLLIIPFFAIVKYRRGVSAQLSARLSESSTWIGRRLATGLRTTPIAHEKHYENLRDLLNLKAHPWGLFILVAALIGLVAFVESIVNPVRVGAVLGAVPLFFLWAGSWLPLGSLLTYVGNRYGVPVISLLLIAVIVFSVFNDNHEIRSAGPLAQRTPVMEALERWRQEQLKQGNHQLLLVAAAGGGIRAAYWTVTVLGYLHDRVDGFDNRLFALSSVSGGSLGAAVYRAAIADGATKDLSKKMTTVLSGDFLAPAVAGLLYPDLAQRFLPYVGLPDRGVAMEKGWEAAYRKAMNSNRFAEPMMALYHDAKPWPALMLNATRVETGRRSIASNLELRVASKPQAFAVIDDQLEALGHDLALSSAAFNSARFPGISPAGHWKENGKIAGRLVDGAYFENFGAEALIGLLRVIDWNNREWKHFKPVVIAITSDPKMADDFYKASEDPQIISVFHEAVSPIQAALKTSSSHSIEALLRLKRDTEARGGQFLHFRMCPQDKGATRDYSPPLGWSLSGIARKTIHGYLGEEACNKSAIRQLRKIAGFSADP